MKELKARINLKTTLILYALIPLIVTSLVIGVACILKSRNEIKGYTHDSLVQVISDVGTAFDTMVEKNEATLQAYATSPILKEALLHPDNEEILAQAQQYTLDYFDQFAGGEGLYLASWESKVMTHPSAPVIGKVLREGDSLKQLQDAMVNSKGVYNTGIMVSPASGNLIMSLYSPIMVDGIPIGYVGCGFYVGTVAEGLSDVSALNINTAYVYFVDHEGTMVFHPNAEKIGQPVENEAVKTLVGELKDGKMPDPDILTYNYKGKTKYAGYYIGNNGYYIAVLTADEDDVLSGVNSIRLTTIIIIISCIILFSIIALLVERIISRPLVQVAGSLNGLGTGDVTIDCDAKSHMRETVSIVNSFFALREALGSSIKSVKDSALELDNSIKNVDAMTANNTESVQNINMAIGEVSETSQSVSSNAQLIAEKTADLGTSIEQLNSNVENLYDASKVIESANGDATECMKSVHNGAQKSVSAMEEINSKIVEMNDAISKIGAAVQAIDEIASQTNLLSLNASIEAAHAGDSGRGFAVVADEIRHLADSSAESAREIKQLIGDITNLSHETVEISNNVTGVIKKEQDDIETAQEKFDALSESVETSMREISTIRQMSESLDSIKAELTNATADLGTISEELGASAEEVAATCQSVAQSCNDTQASTEDMRKANDTMNDAIAFFKLS